MTLILRLVIDRERQVLHGEVGNTAAEPAGERWIGFRGLAGLLPAVQGVLGE